MRKVLVLLGLLAAACTAWNQQKAQPPKPDQLVFKNLKVLRPNITRDELIPIMRTFAQSLGVRCEHCHVKTADEPKQTFDFASDAKPEKNAARMMIQMVRRVNLDYVSKVKREEGTTVACYTCHRGRVTPESKLPVARPPQVEPPH